FRHLESIKKGGRNAGKGSKRRRKTHPPGSSRGRGYKKPEDQPQALALTVGIRPRAQLIARIERLILIWKAFMFINISSNSPIICYLSEALVASINLITPR